MKELIATLEEIHNDFYKGIYTVGEFHDLVQEINNVLNKKQFTS